MLTYSLQWQTRVLPELCCSCDGTKLPGSSGPRVVFSPPPSTRPFFLYIAAIVNSWHCSGRSSIGWWMFIVSERVLDFFSNLEHCCLLFGAEDAPSMFLSLQALIFQLGRWCQVIYIPYVMCRSKLPLGT